VDDRARLRRLAATPRVRRALVVAVVAVATAVAAAVPISPVKRLANYSPDGPGPIYDHSGIDDAALRRAGKLLPDGARYLVLARPYGDVQSAALLYFDPALPVGDPRLATWVLSYHAGRGLPGGLRAVRTYRLGEGIFLFRVRGARA
jgi:hypothetical protein